MWGYRGREKNKSSSNQPESDLYWFAVKGQISVQLTKGCLKNED